jgi:hypothetical protein
MKPVEVKVKDIVSACEASYDAGVRDGVRYSANVLDALGKEIMKKHNDASVLVDFCNTVKQAFEDQANLIHAKLEEKDREP